MNVLILGINGFIGNAVAAHAAKLGHRITAMARSSVCQSNVDLTYVCGDRRDPGLLTRVLGEYRIEAVVDVLAMTLQDTQPVLACLQHAAVSQYVMISSCDVYANYELLQKRAAGEPELQPLREEAALRSTRYPYREAQPRPADAADRYLDDYDKIPIEEAVQKLDCAFTILRLPMVYGPGDKQKRFRWAILPMLKGERSLVVPKQWAQWRSTYGYIENVGAAVAAALGDTRAENSTFNLAEAQPVSQLEWAQKFADVLGWRGEIKLSDDPNHPFARRVSGLDLTVPFVISGQKFREHLGFTDVVGATMALNRTIDSERSG